MVGINLCNCQYLDIRIPFREQNMKVDIMQPLPLGVRGLLEEAGAKTLMMLIRT